MGLELCLEDRFHLDRPRSDCLTCFSRRLDCTDRVDCSEGAGMGDIGGDTVNRLPVASIVSCYRKKSFSKRHYDGFAISIHIDECMYDNRTDIIYICYDILGTAGRQLFIAMQLPPICT